MRKVIGGDGQDNTAAAQAWLASTPNLLLRDLILIGEPEHPQAIRMTDHEAPVLYSPLGVFRPAVVKRGRVAAKIGLDAQSLSITWTPSNQTPGLSIGGATPAQLARAHFYDNWPVRILRALMPSPGDANSIGCATWFGGRVETVQPERGGITFNCRSNLSVLTQKVPSTVIEVTNTLAGGQAVTVPSGDASAPVFQCVAGSTENYILADCLSPSAGHIYSNDLFRRGYMVFLKSSGSTLEGVWSAIGQNGNFNAGGGVHHSEFQIYSPLPWPPTPGIDTFYVSMEPPINLGDESYYGFPYVPNPQTAV